MVSSDKYREWREGRKGGGDRWGQLCVGVCECVWIHLLLDVPDLHAGRAAAAGAHEGLRPQLRDLCAPCLNTHTHTRTKLQTLSDFS